MRVILDGTVVKIRLDKRATGISMLVALDVRRDGRRFFLACETWAARASCLARSSWTTWSPASSPRRSC